MQINNSFDPSSILNIDVETFLEGFILGKSLDYLLKKIHLRDKGRLFFYQLRTWKYELLYNYEGWKIDRKYYKKTPKFVNRELTRTEKYYLTQQIISEKLYNPESSEGFKVWAPLFKDVYPEKFKEFFGETKSELKAKLNIQKFFQNVFA